MVGMSQAKKLGHVANGRSAALYDLHREGHLLAAGSSSRYEDELLLMGKFVCLQLHSFAYGHCAWPRVCNFMFKCGI